MAANHRTNERIRVPKIRLVGDNVEPGVYDTRQAQRMAEDMDLDLVEISPKADPPVCKIIDYSKFMYDQRKKQKELAAKAVKVVIKEIRFGPNTSDHDYEFKKKHAIEFLQSGAKVKAFVFFRGRSIVFKDKGEILLLRLAQDLEEYGKVEHMPSMDGKKMNITIAPKK
ncbi:MAG: translation initiation factor IF-3 [Schleiferiaceae bacterium]